MSSLIAPYILALFKENTRKTMNFMPLYTQKSLVEASKKE